MMLAKILKKRCLTRSNCRHLSLQRYSFYNEPFPKSLRRLSCSSVLVFASFMGILLFYKMRSKAMFESFYNVFLPNYVSVIFDDDNFRELGMPMKVELLKDVFFFTKDPIFWNSEAFYGDKELSSLFFVAFERMAEDRLDSGNCDLYEWAAQQLIFLTQDRRCTDLLVRKHPEIVELTARLLTSEIDGASQRNGQSSPGGMARVACLRFYEVLNRVKFNPRGRRILADIGYLSASREEGRTQIRRIRLRSQVESVLRQSFTTICLYAAASAVYNRSFRLVKGSVLPIVSVLSFFSVFEAYSQKVQTYIHGGITRLGERLEVPDGWLRWASKNPGVQMAGVQLGLALKAAHLRAPPIPPLVMVYLLVASKGASKQSNNYGAAEFMQMAWAVKLMLAQWFK